ncbi:MAG: hypothetical protein J6C86_01770 [Bacteroidaceae bacterium]|nr:hypothetical protein [Bacteroidaceae bacterium]
MGYNGGNRWMHFWFALIKDKHKIMLLLFVLSIALTSCGNENYKHERFDWEIEDSIKKAKEDSINGFLKKIRDKADTIMSEDKTVFRGIYLGQNRKDYEKELKRIQADFGYTALKIGDIGLDIWDAEFHHNKLYSLTLKHDYIYREYRREYNSGAEYHPEPYIRDLITHFKKKYGLPDDEYSGYDEIRGHERADCIRMYWVFPKKRITIKNKAEKYGGGTAGASYVLTIKIDDYNITNMLENEKREREKAEKKKRDKEDSILNKKRTDLSNTI